MFLLMCRDYEVGRCVLQGQELRHTVARNLMRCHYTSVSVIGSLCVLYKNHTVKKKNPACSIVPAPTVLRLSCKWMSGLDSWKNSKSWVKEWFSALELKWMEVNERGVEVGREGNMTIGDKSDVSRHDHRMCVCVLRGGSKLLHNS